MGRDSAEAGKEVPDAASRRELHLEARSEEPPEQIPVVEVRRDFVEPPRGADLVRIDSEIGRVGNPPLGARREDDLLGLEREHVALGVDVRLLEDDDRVADRRVESGLLADLPRRRGRRRLPRFDRAAREHPAVRPRGPHEREPTVGVADADRSRQGGSLLRPLAERLDSVRREPERLAFAWRVGCETVRHRVVTWSAHRYRSFVCPTLINEIGRKIR
jgi:hypothetical protein